MTYPLAFRKKVLSVKERDNLTHGAAAKRFDIGKDTITRWKQTLEPKISKNRPAIKIDMEALQKDVHDKPDAYQYERANTLGVSKSCVHYALRRLGLSYKKNV